MMAVLVRMTVVGMDESSYDQAAGQLGELLRKQPGFIMHVAYPGPGGMGAGEVWEIREQCDTWFNEIVKPNVTFEIKQEFIELHNIITP
jgi:hypothetical protein